MKFKVGEQIFLVGPSFIITTEIVGLEDEEKYKVRVISDTDANLSRRWEIGYQFCIPYNDENLWNLDLNYVRLRKLNEI